VLTFKLDSGKHIRFFRFGNFIQVCVTKIHFYIIQLLKLDALFT
jgi:hypothetical protein